MSERRNGSVARRAAPELRGFVDGYVGYRVVAAPPGIHRGLPSRHLTCIVSLRDTIDVLAHSDPQQRPARFGFVLSGLHATAATIARGGDEEGVAIELTPPGARALLGLPAGQLWNSSLEAADVLGSRAIELRERLHSVARWEDRFAVCDRVLRRLLARDHRPPAGELEGAWRMIVGSGGSVPIFDLASAVGWSRRHLTERFASEFGATPKLAARIVRFDAARRMLERTDAPPIATVAAACGYYDQPHLTREFAELAGCPPGEWLANEFPSVQDSSPREAARSRP